MEQIQFVQVTPEQLQTKIIEGIKELILQYKTLFQTKQPDEYLTRQETADFFKVDLSTLWHWKNKGFLIPYGAEGIVRYKRSDVETAMVIFKTKKQ